MERTRQERELRKVAATYYWQRRAELRSQATQSQESLERLAPWLDHTHICERVRRLPQRATRAWIEEALEFAAEACKPEYASRTYGLGTVTRIGILNGMSYAVTIDKETGYRRGRFQTSNKVVEVYETKHGKERNVTKVGRTPGGRVYWIAKSRRSTLTYVQGGNRGTNANMKHYKYTSNGARYKYATTEKRACRFEFAKNVKILSHSYQKQAA